uniref:Uncharacterized protein n=1 Tax=Nelumbo nucifera TaxID=4432 RepID=A0A822Y298_NELNU|nr:TPA_asm: hypothetical protein HUJ06_025251 [Nelumbo nucifera]
MSSPSKRREMDLMKLMMSDYKVEMINDGMQEFYVDFNGPSDSKFSTPDAFPSFIMLFSSLIIYISVFVYFLFWVSVIFVVNFLFRSCWPSLDVPKRRLLLGFVWDSNSFDQFRKTVVDIYICVLLLSFVYCEFRNEILFYVLEFNLGS